MNLGKCSYLNKNDTNDFNFALTDMEKQSGEIVNFQKIKI